jgi:hypothetical protein
MGWIDTHLHLNSSVFSGTGSLRDEANLINDLRASQAYDAIDGMLLTMFPLPYNEGEVSPIYLGTSALFDRLVQQYPDIFPGMVVGGREINAVLHEHAEVTRNLPVSSPTYGHLTNAYLGRLTDTFAVLTGRYGAAGSNTLRGIGELALLHIAWDDTAPYMEVPPNGPMMLRLVDLVAMYQRSYGVRLPICVHMEVVHGFMNFGVELLDRTTGEGAFYLDMHKRWQALSRTLNRRYPDQGALQAAYPQRNAALIPANWLPFLDLLAYAQSRDVTIVWEHLGQAFTGVQGTWLRDQLDVLWRTAERGGRGFQQTLVMSCKVWREEANPFQVDDEGLLATIDVRGQARLVLPAVWHEFIRRHAYNLTLGSDQFFGNHDIYDRTFPHQQMLCRTLWSRLPESTAARVGEETAVRVYGLDR